MYRALGNLLKASGGLAKKGGRAAADVFLPKDTKYWRASRYDYS